MSGAWSSSGAAGDLCQSCPLRQGADTRAPELALGGLDLAREAKATVAVLSELLHAFRAQAADEGNANLAEVVAHFAALVDMAFKPVTESAGMLLAWQEARQALQDAARGLKGGKS